MNETKTPSRIKFAYVGCGFVGQTIHIPNFASLPECEFVGLAEVRQELGKKVAERYRIPKLYRSHHELAEDPEIQAVGVSAPWTIQSRIAEDLLRAGKSVFMEKPMAVSVSRAKAMNDAVAASGGKARLMVGYMKRYDTGHVLFKKRFDAWRKSTELGRLLFVRNHGFCGHWTYAQDPSIPFEHSAEPGPSAPDDCPRWLPEKWRTPYLHYLQQYTHNLNWLRFLLADEQGNVRSVVKSAELDSDGLTGIVVLEINGVRAVVESGGTKFHAWDDHTQVYFEGGWLRTESPPLTQKTTSATVELYRAAHDDVPPTHTREIAAPGWHYREEAQHFLQCLQTNAPFRSSSQDTVGDVELYEEIYSKFLSVPRS